MDALRRLCTVSCLCAAVTACGDSPDPSGRTAPELASLVARIDVLPPVVQVSPGAHVILHARLVTAQDHLVPWTAVTGEPPPPELWWDFPDDVEVQGGSSTDPFIRLVIPDEPPAGFHERLITITATLADESLGTEELVPGAASIVVIGSAVPPGVRYDSVAGLSFGFPQVARIRGPSATGFSEDLWFAFVGAGRFGDLGFSGNVAAQATGTDGSVDLLSVVERHRNLPHQWQAGAERIERSIGPRRIPLDTPTRLPVRVWKAVTEIETTGSPEVVDITDVQNLVEMQLAYARIILALNRTGIWPTLVDIRDYGSDLVISWNVGTRQFLMPWPEQGGTVDACGFLASPELQVFIVRDLSPGSGYSCEDKPVIFLEYRDIVGNGVAAHELAHQLALRDPDSGTQTGVGHTDTIAGFGSWNLMQGAFSDEISGERAHLSVGQAFRMNRHITSWVHTERADLPVDCGATSQGNEECPRLALDLPDLVGVAP